MAVGIYSNLTGDGVDESQTPPALGFGILPSSGAEGELKEHIMQICHHGFPITDPAQYVQIIFRDLLTGRPIKFQKPPLCSVILTLTHINI